VISVIIPVYRDAAALGRTLEAVDFTGVEVIVAATADDLSLAPLRLAHPGLVWIDAPRGRARQMNAGAAVARGEWLVFLHADTRLPSGWPAAIHEASRGVQGLRRNASHATANTRKASTMPPAICSFQYG